MIVGQYVTSKEKEKEAGGMERKERGFSIRLSKINK
jgi:hypothetical protein